MTPIPRTPERRLRDTMRRLEEDVDAWVATAGDGAPNLAPLSFLWDGATLLFATPAAGATGRNLLRGGTVRVGVGPTRDVVLIEGTAEAVSPEGISRDVGDAFAAKTGFDPRKGEGYSYFSIRPRRIEAWREVDEFPGRHLMRDGRWLVG